MLKITDQNLKDFICLGVLINDNWVCGSRQITQLLTAANSPSNNAMIEFSVPGPGTYAVIFNPDPVKNIYLYTKKLNYILENAHDQKKNMWSSVQKLEVNHYRDIYSDAFVFDFDVAELQNV
jgi:hypothetical protein